MKRKDGRDHLWERAQAALSESRRLADDRARILEIMTDTAVHRQILAEDFARWTEAAGSRASRVGRHAVRAGLEKVDSDK
jgi:hypothetical protein